jgi:L-rhamnose isomerase
MKDLKISVGMWYMGATGDRFVKAGYRPDRTIEERFEAAAKIPGVGGLEMHYPTEINDKNWKDLKKRAADRGLKFVMLTPHLWIDPVYKFGQFSNPDAKLRRRAIDFAKKVTDLGGELGVKFMCYWPAQDGYDYPFQVDFPKRWDTLAEGLAEWADYHKDQKIVVEYKAYDPRAHILLPNVGQTVTLLNEINRPNLGINIETGHALIMNENLAETFAFAMRYKRLFHTHWNDNSKMYDDDAMVGMVNLWETVELLFWLDELGYDGWFGLDLFPFREMPEDAVAQSIANMKMGYAMLDRVDREELRGCFSSSDAIRIAQLMRRMLGETG